MKDISTVPVILVVDDNPQNLQLIGGLLGESLEFDLSFASSGREALDILQVVVPDLVLLDVNMPGMDGFEVCRQIRSSAATRYCPVIFLTAQSEMDFIVEGFRAGGNDYMVKPFEANELLARVRVQLEMATRLRISMTETEQAMTELRELNRDLEDKVRIRTAEAERNEAEVRAVLENIAEGVIVLTEGEVVESGNPMAKTMFGDGQEQLAGREFYSLFNAEHHAHLRQQMADVALSVDAASLKVEEFSACRLGGDSFPVELIISEIRANDYHRKVAVIRDITRRKETEAQLAETQKLLLDAAHQSGMAEIATGVLHNIGNVLNSVCLSAEELDRLARESKTANLVKANALLQENKHRLAEFLTEDPKGRKLIDYYQQLTGFIQQEFATIKLETAAVLEKTNMMREVISTQQDYAKVQQLSMEVNIESLLDDVMKVEGTSLEKWGVNLSTALQPLPPCLAHKAKLLQVVTNLIKNARESTAQNDMLNKPKNISVESGTHDVGHAYMKISDNGVGILSENLTRIFQLGFTTKKSGHGFGLHSSINAMREMHGDLHVESAGLHAGADFTLIIPFAEAVHNAKSYSRC